MPNLPRSHSTRGSEVGVGTCERAGEAMMSLVAKMRIKNM